MHVRAFGAAWNARSQSVAPLPYLPAIFADITGLTWLPEALPVMPLVEECDRVRMLPASQRMQYVSRLEAEAREHPLVPVTYS